MGIICSYFGKKRKRETTFSDNKTLVTPPAFDTNEDSPKLHRNSHNHETISEEVNETNQIKEDLTPTNHTDDANQVTATNIDTHETPNLNVEKHETEHPEKTDVKEDLVTVEMSPAEDIRNISQEIESQVKPQIISEDTSRNEVESTKEVEVDGNISPEIETQVKPQEISEDTSRNEIESTKEVEVDGNMMDFSIINQDIADDDTVAIPQEKTPEVTTTGETTKVVLTFDSEEKDTEADGNAEVEAVASARVDEKEEDDSMKDFSIISQTDADKEDELVSPTEQPEQNTQDMKQEQ